MIKVYCDICNTEIKPKEMVGNISYLETDWKQAIKVGNDKSIIEVKLTTCENCTSDVKKYIEDKLQKFGAVDGQK